MLTSNDFGIKRCIHDYVLSRPPAVPSIFEKPEAHETSGCFSAGNIAFCPRKDYYSRAGKHLHRLPFDPLPVELKSAWAMYAGAFIEQCVVLPALQASERYDVMFTQREVMDAANERRGFVDFWLLDKAQGCELILECKTSHSQSWRYKQADEKKGILPASEHNLAQPMWYYNHQRTPCPDIRVALIEIARDHIGFCDEYIAIPQDGKVYKLRGDRLGVQPYGLPPICDATVQGNRARARLECWQAHRLPPAEPSYPKWECDYCPYVNGCKENTNILEVKDGTEA